MEQLYVFKEKQVQAGMKETKRVYDSISTDSCFQDNGSEYA